MQISLKIKTFAALTMGFLLFFGQNGFGQTHSRQEYEELAGGLIGGVNFTQVDGDGYRGYKKMGFTGGGILYLPLGNNVGLPFDATLAFSMEVLYEQKGAHGVGPVAQSGVIAQDIQLHYAEVPFQINLYRGPQRSGFGMGLAISYLGFSEETIDLGQTTKLKNALPFHKFDLSYVLTANIHVFKGLFVSPRFEYSLVSIRHNDEQKYGGRTQQFNNTLSVRLMYLFGEAH